MKKYKITYYYVPIMPTINDQPHKISCVIYATSNKHMFDIIKEMVWNNAIISIKLLSELDRVVLDE